MSFHQLLNIQNKYPLEKPIKCNQTHVEPLFQHKMVSTKVMWKKNIKQVSFHHALKLNTDTEYDEDQIK